MKDRFRKKRRKQWAKHKCAKSWRKKWVKRVCFPPYKRDWPAGSASWAELQLYSYKTSSTCSCAGYKLKIWSQKCNSGYLGKYSIYQVTQQANQPGSTAKTVTELVDILRQQLKARSLKAYSHDSNSSLMHVFSTTKLRTIVFARIWTDSPIL